MNFVPYRSPNPRGNYLLRGLLLTTGCGVGPQLIARMMLESNEGLLSTRGLGGTAVIGIQLVAGAIALLAGALVSFVPEERRGDFLAGWGVGLVFTLFLSIAFWKIL